MLAGQLQPLSGTLYFEGILYTDTPNLQRKIGFVPQSVILFDRSLRENLVYGSSNLDLDKELHRLGLIHYFKQIGLDTQVGKRGSMLSESQRKMVMFTRVVTQNPEVLIVDDPTAGLSDDNARILRPDSVPFV
jgi:ABC-type multidrug transport system fused ATPase/permease subunit